MLKENLKGLIEFKTLSKDHVENKKALDWIKNLLAPFPLYVKEFDFHNFPSLVLTTRPTKTPILWLQAHLDVVDGSPEVFRPKVTGQRLFGRGAFDMKFAIACYLQLLKDLSRQSRDYDFGIMITTDEEVGGENGVGALLQKGFSSKVCFLPDGGQNWEIQKAAKGVLHLSLESRGKSTHGSRPWQGENAIEELLGSFNYLKGIFPKEPCHLNDHFHSTINLGKIEGGKAANQVPDSATALVDIRFIPSDEKKIFERIQSTKEKYKDVRFKKIASGNAFDLDPKNGYLKSYLEVVQKITGRTPSFITSHGSSDARFFAQRNIPVIATRPNGGGHHSEREWVNLDDLKIFYKVLKEFVIVNAKSK